MEVSVVQGLLLYEKKTTAQVQILGDAICISHCTNTPEESMNLIILFPVMSKW